MSFMDQILGHPELMGVFPRTVNSLFTQMQNNPEIEYCVKVNYISIYLEDIHDLLSGDMNERLCMKESPTRSIRKF